MPVISTACASCKCRFTRADRPVKCDGCPRRVHGKCSKPSARESHCPTDRILTFFCDSCDPTGRLFTTQIERRDNTEETAKPVRENSGLHKINMFSKNPMDVFREWYAEHMTTNASVTSAKAFSLATVSNTGKVSCRSLILRRLDEDGFVMMTDGRSRKSKDLADNPQASMVFLWLDKTADNSPRTRQVRVEGSAKTLNADSMKELYDVEPLFCKIRARICEQGKAVEWEQLKHDHDQLFDKVINNDIQLPRPDHIVAYKLVPDVIEFYEATGENIGDRLLFVKNGILWQPNRIAA